LCAAAIEKPLSASSAALGIHFQGAHSPEYHLSNRLIDNLSLI